MPRTTGYTLGNVHVYLPAPLVALFPLMSPWILRALVPLRGYFNWLVADGFDVSSGCQTVDLGFSEWEKDEARTRSTANAEPWRFRSHGAMRAFPSAGRRRGVRRCFAGRMRHPAGPRSRPIGFVSEP